MKLSGDHKRSLERCPRVVDCSCFIPECCCAAFAIGVLEFEGRGPRVLVFCSSIGLSDQPGRLPLIEA